MDEDILFQSEDLDLSVKIGAGVLSEIVKLVVCAGANETGSVLIGSYIDDRSVLITRCSFIPKGSRGCRCRYKRGTQGLREYYQKVFRDSGGKEYYVGEWHFHPGGEVSPSAIDDSTMACISHEMNDRGMVSVIVGGSIATKPEIGVSVYIGKRRIALRCQNTTSIG